MLRYVASVLSYLFFKSPPELLVRSVVCSLCTFTLLFGWGLSFSLQSSALLDKGWSDLLGGAFHSHEKKIWWFQMACFLNHGFSCNHLPLHYTGMIFFVIIQVNKGTIFVGEPIRKSTILDQLFVSDSTYNYGYTI